MSGPDELSYSLEPEIDAELDAALQRNVAAGTASAGTIAANGLAAANIAPDTATQPAVSAEQAIAWAEKDLAETGAFANWQRCKDVLGTEIPKSLADIDMPDKEARLTRLMEIKTRLFINGARTPSGETMADDLHLVMIPWGAFESVMIRHDTVVHRLTAILSAVEPDREIALSPEYTTNAEWYRNPVAPHHFATNNTEAAAWQTPADYVLGRLASDGPWGIMLAQTGREAGLEQWTGKTPRALTACGTERLMLGQHKVDSLGILEWMAIVQQSDWAHDIAGVGRCVLLANRFTSTDALLGSHGLVGTAEKFDDWQSKRLYCDVVEDDLEDAQPRIAILG